MRYLAGLILLFLSYPCFAIPPFKVVDDKIVYLHDDYAVQFPTATINPYPTPNSFELAVTTSLLTTGNYSKISQLFTKQGIKSSLIDASAQLSNLQSAQIQSPLVDFSQEISLVRNKIAILNSLYLTVP